MLNIFVSQLYFKNGSSKASKNSANLRASWFLVCINSGLLMTLK